MALKAFMKVFSYTPKSEKESDRPTVFHFKTLPRNEILEIMSDMIDLVGIDPKGVKEIPPSMVGEVAKMYTNLLKRSTVMVENFYLGDKFMESSKDPDTISKFLDYLPNIDLVLELGEQVFSFNTPSEPEIKNSSSPSE